MDTETLSKIHHIYQQALQQQDWKAALDTLFVSLRGSFVFDNVALYLQDSKHKGLEGVYARALGRGKTAEAEADWGEEIASEALVVNRMILREPKKSKQAVKDRLSQAYFLAFPLLLADQPSGALVFVRFGGPAYSAAHIHIAALQAFASAALLARRELQAARSEADSVQRQMRLQDDFVSTITHELRTPLGFIKGYSTSLLREDTVWDAATQREFLNIIDEEADRLAKLIDDMLESARLHSQTLPFKFSPVRVDALLRDVATRMNIRHPNLNIRLALEPVPPTQGDAKRLSQVFENLLSNALKYAPQSELRLRAFRQGGVIRIEFADSGEGIAPEYLPFLFERFYRVPGEHGERAVTGTGLGLYICRQIIMAHHGTIWAESKLGVGTTFIIELPVDGG
ncbi:MAG: hypothetical protein Fur002_06780 [Anaerolineales bacterium]